MPSPKQQQVIPRATREEVMLVADATLLQLRWEIATTIRGLLSQRPWLLSLLFVSPPLPGIRKSAGMVAMGFGPDDT